VSASAAILLLTGCGGGSDSSSSTQSNASTTITGQFIDSAVQGLDYNCSSGNSGVTDAFGNFTCNSGDTVAFSINDFVIGSVTMQSIVTPTTLFPSDSTAVTNLAQFLQTLDSDGNPNNGITIDKTSQEVQALNGITGINFAQVDFDSVMTSYIGKVLVDETTANNHLELTTKNIANSSGDVNSLSVVVVLNNVTESICQANNPYEYSYDGYSDYLDFLNAGGSTSLNYFSSSKSCSEYSGSGFCTVQDYANVGFEVSGTGSCVQVVTFPAADTIDDSTSEVTLSEEYMTQGELDSDLANGYISTSVYNYQNSLYITDKNRQNEIWSAVKNHKNINGTTYYVEGYNKLLSSARVEFYGIEFYDTNSLRLPRITHIVTTDSIGEASSDGYNGIGTYTLTDEYLDWGGGDKFKFSKILDNNLLKNIYPNINFTSGDVGQYIYFMSTYGLSIRLYVNESAKGKLLLSIQNNL